MSLTLRSPSCPWRLDSASRTSAKVSIPIICPWSMTTSEPMSCCAMALTASSTVPFGGVVNRALPLMRRISLTSMVRPRRCCSLRSRPRYPVSLLPAPADAQRLGAPAMTVDDVRQPHRDLRKDIDQEHRHEHHEQEG